MYATLKETLRTHPPGPAIIRKVEKDTVLGGYFVPKGSLAGMVSAQDA